MKITLHFHQTMKFSLKEDYAILELPEEANLQDLYGAFALYVENKPPLGLWNPKLKCFRGPVVFYSDGACLNKKSIFYDGQHIEIKRLVVGG